MRILLDTCALLWWWAEPESLSPRALALIKDPHNNFLVSAASAWEVSAKFRIGKLAQGGVLVEEWSDRLAADGFGELPISATHALRAGVLPGEHRDPFDRMIAAQSIIEQVPVMSSDLEISRLGAQLIW
jgi:PIN domain nuclease of toxin-antitoxin system